MAMEAAGRLTTHVLDTARGLPAAGLALSLHRLGDGAREHLLSTVTNADGRCDAPLLSGDAFRSGRYELVFEAGPYLRNTQPGLAGEGPLFLDDVVIRFGIGEAAHYHVPLLLSPFGYSTYRGS